MPTDTRIGVLEQFEDFLVTAIADLPEIDTGASTGETKAVVSSAKDGRLRNTVAASNDDEASAVSFNLNYTPGDGELYMEARFLLSALTDNMYFVGFGDGIASSKTKACQATADTVAVGASTAMADCIGILFDQDATTKNLWCVAIKTSAVTVGKVLAAKYNPTITAMVTLGVYLSTDRKSAAFYVNGEEVYRLDSTTTLIAAVALAPGVWTYEQATALNLDVDYLYARKARAAV